MEIFFGLAIVRRGLNIILLNQIVKLVLSIFLLKKKWGEGDCPPMPILKPVLAWVVQRFFFD